MTWVLGLTGGIASGKTTVANAFANLGITLVDTDLLAREVVAPTQPAWQAIAQHFGPQALQANQALDRAWLRQRVFANPSDRQFLEAQIHPRVRELSRQRLAAACGPYVILVSPLLFETGQHLECHRTLLVTLPLALQQQRLMARDGGSLEQAEHIMASQMPLAAKITLADDLFDNSLPLTCLSERVQSLHQDYCQRAL